MYCKVWTFIELWYVKMHVSRSLEMIASHKIICKASIFPGRFKSIEFNSIIYSKDTTKNLYRGKWDQYFISLMLFDEANFFFIFESKGMLQMQNKESILSIDFYYSRMLLFPQILLFVYLFFIFLSIVYSGPPRGGRHMIFVGVPRWQWSDDLRTITASKVINKLCWNIGQIVK